MEFTIERSLFTDALKSVQGAVEKRSTMPILSNVYLNTADGKLTLITTDLEVGIKVTLAADVKKTGIFTLSAKKLLELVAAGAGDKVTVRVQPNNRCEVVSGKFKPTMFGLPGEDFPPLPAFDEGEFFTFDSKLLLDMIDKTLFASSVDETRVALNGVFLEKSPQGDKSLRMVATDGHRLSLIERELEGTRSPVTGGVILHRKSVQELRKLCERSPKVELSIQKNHVTAKTDDVVVLMRLVEAEFPKYANVIPEKSDRKATVGRDEMVAALKRVAIMSDDRTHLVKIKVEKGKILVECNNQSLGEAAEEISCAYDGAPLQIGFNVRYLTDALEHSTGGDVQVSFIDEINPVTLVSAGDPSYLNVIMPMRI